MAIATDVQINTGPTATTFHHAAAWVQATFEVSAVGAMGITLFALLVGLLGLLAVGAGIHHLTRSRSISIRPLYISLSLFKK